jgi:hypothetical protein
MKKDIMAKHFMSTSYIISAILVFILLFSGIRGAGSDDPLEITCNAASFCSGTEAISCTTIEDGYCPYDFGDWSADLIDGKKCKIFVHNEGTSDEFSDFCEVCDPDCATNQGFNCFSETALNLKDVQVQTGR